VGDNLKVPKVYYLIFTTEKKLGRGRELKEGEWEKQMDWII